jgi:hypothetical protein
MEKEAQRCSWKTAKIATFVSRDFDRTSADRTLIATTPFSLSFAPSPDENYQLDTSATPTADTGAVAAVKLLFQGKVDSAEEATNLMHLQRADTKTQLSDRGYRQ